MEISLNQKVEDALRQAGVSFCLASVDCNLYEVAVPKSKVEAESDKITEAIRSLISQGVEAEERKINARALISTYIFSQREEKVSVSVLLT